MEKEHDHWIRFSEKGNFWITIIVFAGLIAGMFYLSTLRGDNEVNYDVDETSFTVTGPEEFRHTIALDSIVSWELVRLTDVGEQLSGVDNEDLRAGVWRNDAWGEYTMCTLKSFDTALLFTTDSERLVFNYQSRDATQTLLEAFTQLMEERGAAPA